MLRSILSVRASTALLQELRLTSSVSPQYLFPVNALSKPCFKHVHSTTLTSLPNEPNNDLQKKGPLSGVRVLDLTRVLAGPFATMLLSDLGASVIKVEKPGVGDETRIWGPPFLGAESCYFMGVNRNKTSLAVNLKTEAGKDILRNLALQCDVLIENFVPGTLSRLGLGYEDLQADAPGLIYCSLTGYGPTGPYSDRPGYDVMAASVGGLMAVTGPASGPPCKVGVAMTDLATGLYAHGAIMAALLDRNKTGLGQKIDCDLLSTQVACMANLASSYLNAGVEAKPLGTAHASIVPYQAFQTGDGFVSVAGNTNVQFAALCARLDLSHLVEDERYNINSSRVVNRESLIYVLEERFKECSTQEWLEKFEGATFPYAPVNNLSQTFKDPQVEHRGLVQTVQHPTAGSVKVVGPAVQFSRSHNEVRGSPPLLGQHTKEILMDLLDFSAEEVDSLEKLGVVQCAE